MSDTKLPGWFSRRHRTGDAHAEARANYQINHGREARREKAEERSQRVTKRLFCGHTTSLREMDHILRAGCPVA